MSNGQKISQFISDSSILDTDEFTFVRGGFNLKTPYSALKLNLGVTGALSTSGDPFGTPILLEPALGSFKIRNIETSKGITSSASAQNGALISTNFSNGAIGAKIIKDISADALIFRSLSAGAGINISESGDEIQISTVLTPISTKTIIISSINDFPAAIGGVITLADNTDYLIVQDIITTSRFESTGNNVIRGSSSQIIKITYNGTGTMFTATVNPNLKINDLTLSAQNGKCFNVSSTGTGVFQLLCVNIENCKEVGDIGSMFIARFDNVAYENIQLNGWLFTGTIINLDVFTSIIFQLAGIFIDLSTALFNAISISTQVFQPTSSGVFLSGQLNSANILPNGLGFCSNNRTLGVITPLNSVSDNDANWNFIGNDNIQDTRPDALINLNSNAVATTISAVNTPVLIAGVWVIDRNSQTTATTNGKITYNANKNAVLPITLTASIRPVSGTDKQASTYISINGVVITGTKSTATVNSSKSGSTTSIWQLNVKTNDYIEVFIENNSDTTNLIVNDAVFRVN